jgi:hypothetical protein
MRNFLLPMRENGAEWFGRLTTGAFAITEGIKPSPSTRPD